MKIIPSIVVIILTIIFIIPFVSSQSINYIEVNGTTFTQPEAINITGWTDNSSSETYLWNDYNGTFQPMLPNGTGTQTNITLSSNLNTGDYTVYCNSTWNSTLAWKSFSVASVTTNVTTTTTQETTTTTETTMLTTIPETTTTVETTTSTLPSKVEDKEPPTWSNLRHEPSVVKKTDSVNIIVDWLDNVYLDTVIIYENSTSVWKEHVCDKATGRCSLGIVNLSVISADMASSLLIVGFVIVFAVIIIVLIKVVHAPKIISSFLAIVLFIFLLSIFLSPELSRNMSRTFSRLGIIPVGPVITFSHTILASELNAGDVVSYYSYANDTSGNNNTTEIKSFTVQAIEVVTKIKKPPEVTPPTPEHYLQRFDFEKSREENVSLVKDFYVRSTLDTEDLDNKVWDWNPVSKEKKINGSSSLFYDLDFNKNINDGDVIYSKTMDLNETEFIEITFYYYPKFSGHRANIGFEIISPDDMQTIAIGLTDVKAISSGTDFNVTTENLDNGWKKVSAKTNIIIQPAKLRLFIQGIPYSDDFSSKFFIDEISIRLVK
ncbi:MAG: hypothetical protein NTW30_03880 [Candidatus Aenigmarchaeota archaeon]|nr:hypothetical protein [Candidatus Aenigmarchaeota archaeon]